jgi:hypothetical protein
VLTIQRTAEALIARALPGVVVMQIYQGNFVADIEPIRNKRTPEVTHFRIRVSQLRPVKLLINDSTATDAHAARQRAKAKLCEVLACEQVLSKAA